MLQAWRRTLSVPGWLFLHLFAVAAIADMTFGESKLSNFIPQFGGFDYEFFGTVWFCSIMALVATGAVLVIVRKKLWQSLPWILGATAAILLCFFTIYDNLTTGFNKQYRGFADSIYHPLRHMVPYYLPFQAPREYSYMLSTSAFVFLKAGVIIVAPMIAGYAIVHAKKRDKNEASE